jgi:hypothetical protein
MADDRGGRGVRDGDNGGIRRRCAVAQINFKVGQQQRGTGLIGHHSAEALAVLELIRAGVAGTGRPVLGIGARKATLIGGDLIGRHRLIGALRERDGIDRRASGGERDGLGWPAIVGQPCRGKLGIGIEFAGPAEAAAIVTGNVVAVVDNCASQSGQGSDSRRRLCCEMRLYRGR